MNDAHAKAAADGELHLGSARTDSVRSSVVKVVVPAIEEPAIVFFIGGAGGQEAFYFSGPNRNISDARRILDTRESSLMKLGLYVAMDLNYNNVRSLNDLKKRVMARIPSKSAPVYIVGHSLGGWNGAHLCRILVDAGYNVVMLVTLDPVGRGTLVELASDIPFDPQAEPKAKVWINVRAVPSRPDRTDMIAMLGERWIVESGPNANVEVDLNHADAEGLFLAKLANGMAVVDVVDASIKACTSRSASQSAH